jgi:hypothetical protein
MYNTQNYWVFGLFPSSGILENRIVFLEYRAMEKVQKPSNSLFPLSGILENRIFSRIPDDGKVQKPSNSICCKFPTEYQNVLH